MKYRFVLFDVDGTLVDSADALCRSFVKVMSEETGRPVAPEEYAPYWGVPGTKAFLDYGIVEEERISRGIERWDRYVQELQEYSPPFPGIEALLENLTQKDFVLGIVTSKNDEQLETDLKPSGLLKYFPYQVTASDTKRHKPEPDPLLEMIKRLDAKIGECVYIGDTVYDARCAEAAGMDFALAQWGLIFPQPGGIRTVRELQNPQDVLELVL